MFSPPKPKIELILIFDAYKHNIIKFKIKRINPMSITATNVALKNKYIRQRYMNYISADFSDANNTILIPHDER